jgi:hypothetical protein
VIVATKRDLEDDRSVSTECGMAFAQKHGLKFMEVSSKDGSNVQEAVEALVEDIHVVIQNKP